MTGGYSMTRIILKRKTRKYQNKKNHGSYSMVFHFQDFINAFRKDRAKHGNEVKFVVSEVVNV